MPISLRHRQPTTSLRPSTSRVFAIRFRRSKAGSGFSPQASKLPGVPSKSVRGGRVLDGAPNPVREIVRHPAISRLWAESHRMRQRRSTGVSQPGKKVLDVLALNAQVGQGDGRAQRIAPSNALTDGPPQPKFPTRNSRADGIRAGRRRHDVRLSTDSKKSPSWRLLEQVSRTLRPDARPDGASDP